MLKVKSNMYSLHTNFSTPHCVSFKNSDYRSRFADLIQNEKLPIPDAFRFISFHFNHDSYIPINLSIESLDFLIESQMNELEIIEKMKYVIQQFSRYEHGNNSDYFIDFFNKIMQRFAYRMHEMVEYLKNDKYSKQLSLDKRREKRNRYKTNKRKNHESNSFC